MPQFKDYTGQKINNWNIISHDGFNKNGESIWTVECDCENKITMVKTLTSIKITLKCPECMKRERVKKIKEENIGKKFGKLTIVDYYGHREDIKTKAPFWIAKCDCGSEKEIIANIYDIKNERVKSCGCMKEEAAKKVGKIIGYARKKYNTFIEKEDCYIGVTEKGNYIFDKDDYEKVVSMDRYWFINNVGYVLCSINNKEFQLHRYIMGLDFYDKERDIIVDHINGDKLDNRKSNLRICKKKENPKNCTLYSNNTSGYKGVTWMGRLNKWQVNLQVNKKNLYLGVYSDLEKAIEVRKKAEIKYFGEFSREYRDEVLKSDEIQ